MKPSLLLFSLYYYVVRFTAAFVTPSLRHCSFATPTRKHHSAKNTGQLRSQRDNAETVLSLEKPDPPEGDALPKITHMPHEPTKETRTDKPKPMPQVSISRTKRGDKLLVKDKDSAQFYEARKIGLDPSQSKQYDKIELKSPADEEGASFPLDTLFSRVLDTIEDAVLHARRIPYDLGWFLADTLKNEQRKTIVVLGTFSDDL